MNDKKSDTWMPFYVGDYLSATTRLTTEQHGAYVLLLLDYWKNGPPPNDDAVLAQIARLSPAAWRKARSALIGFFDIKGNALIQKRVELERKRASTITEARSEAGKAGAAKRWHNGEQEDSKRMANAIDLPKAKRQQNDGPSQPPSNSSHKSSLTTSREITRATDCFNEVCAAADWEARTDEQRIEALSVIDGWLALGYDFNNDILAGIRAARSRKPEKTRNLKRFTSTIRGRHADRQGASVNGSDNVGDLHRQHDARELVKRTSAGMTT